MIRPIQYLRALAALSIAWVHAVYGLPSVAQRLGVPYFGSSGVDLFFVISGFIMVAITARGDLTPGRFFSLRLIRVVPLYWLATFATIGMAAWGYAERSSYAPAEIATSLLFVPYASAVRPGDVVPIVQNGWTLNYEMFFYALFALWLAAPRHLRLAGLVLTLGMLFVAGRVAGPFENPIAATFTSPLLLEFASGALLAHIWLRGGLRLGLLQALLLIVLGCYGIGTSRPHLVILAGASFIVAGSLHPRICALENRWLLQLGNASYSLYLTHQFVVDAVVPLWLRLFPHPGWWSCVLYLTCTLLLCTVVAWLCYRFFERPLTSRLRRLLPSPAATAEGESRPMGAAAPASPPPLGNSRP